MSTVKPTRYEYTRLLEVPESGRVNVYGVVRSVTQSSFGGLDIEIEDEDSWISVRVSKQSERFFKALKPNHVLRLHRAEVGSYRNQQALVVELGSYGCHSVAWTGASDKPTLSTSKTHTFTDQDLKRLTELRKWIEDKHASEEAENPTAEAAASTSSCDVRPERSSCREDAVLPNKQVSPTPMCRTISSAFEFNDLRGKFFDWYAQVLGVYRAKGEPSTVFLRVWDGTPPRFPKHLNMFRAHASNVEEPVSEVSDHVSLSIEPYTVDVCCYGDWGRKALKLKVGNVVLLRNIRIYTAQTNNSSAVTMHEGGAKFNRGLIVLDESEPKHAEISRQCAAMISECVRHDSSDLQGAAPSPAQCEKVVAHSTSKGPKDQPDDAPDVQERHGQDEVENMPNPVQVASGSRHVKGLSNPLQSATRPLRGADTNLPSRTTSKEMPRRATTNRAGKLPSSNTQSRLPKDIRDAFVSEIRKTFAKHEIGRMLKELREPKAVQYGLTEEMEEVLKLDVGKSVNILNFIEPDLSVLDEAQYLRNAVLFTAVCKECGDEVVVERCSKNWCRKCFRGEELLRTVRYYYRVIFPAKYVRKNGKETQLNLAIAGDVWASLPNGTDVMSTKKVLELYSEENLTTFIRSLNHIIRYAAAVMKKMKVSDVRGKIYALDRSSGSVTVFVDGCRFTEKKSSRDNVVYT